jgi:hypothetical protein
MFGECREFVEGVLMDESEDEMTLAKRLLLDESDSAVETPEERAIMRKRKAESHSHSPRKGAKKIKSLQSMTPTPLSIPRRTQKPRIKVLIRETVARDQA